jgi:hypothetical protein
MVPQSPSALYVVHPKSVSLTTGAGVGEGVGLKVGSEVGLKVGLVEVGLGVG